jgi:molybdopterin-guanine dinucleotide biosynthesis protein A
MAAGGYVLTGGASFRLGRDKALLAYGGSTLVEHIAATVRAVCGNVTLVGAPARYRHLRLTTIDDHHPGRGPLSGIEAALSHSPHDWNLILACDLPGVQPPLLTRLLATAAAGPADVVAVAAADGRPEPLCAAYHRRTLPVIIDAIASDRLSAWQVLTSMKLTTIQKHPGESLGNINTAEDWLAWPR